MSEKSITAQAGLHRTLAYQPKAGLVLEDYRPVFSCLDFRLSRRFWDLRGVDAFVGGDVPYVVTNDGHLAANGLSTFLAAADTNQTEYNVVELGAGSGLFAKQFMDQLRDRAPEVYAKTTYYATDGSQGMVNAWAENGVFSEHKDHIVPLIAELPGLSNALPKGLKIDAAFANYILDSLPFSLLALSGSEAWELELRTALDRDVDAERVVRMSESDILSCIANDTSDDLAALVDLYPALVLDARYTPIKRSDIPLCDALPAPEGGGARAKPYLHSHGAIETLKDVVKCLNPGGFIAIADYGHNPAADEQDVFEFQHFGGSVAIGLNFSAIDRVVSGWQGIDVVAPATDNGQLMMRLIGSKLSEAIQETFLLVAGKENWDRLTDPLHKAQELTSNGQFEAARWKYEEALRLQPHNWALIEEVAGFLTYRLDAYEAGLMMAKAGIERNSLSPGLWNIAGDCLFYTDHYAEAEEAYHKARLASPRDIRSLLNLAWVAERTGRDDLALDLIAKGLAMDNTDAFRDALIAKQTQILDQRWARHRTDTLRSINRIRGHRDLPRRE
ncbi:hypothetical protein Z946_1844 [Sulfitobacter noctilucicola]|uniref:Tetratricopeptide (TPR) repeat protein n=1 Tax=Sulfitobacter noctilucicola TaxID=1342301 RepID=A0A7W6Q429_9RHOB|nr:SAM-dependent methyltransferase [Sulfitobacter noctilucicola]KIN62981.1 hypothetical protein Z946_1844 [Sulfitobacter noctilucicola]MBB4172492.1 tetratricopeptide (TPR) repeat protein [Sulfitobacter noctilucicola]